MAIAREHLLAEAEELLRTVPTGGFHRGQEAESWLGRAAAVIEEWSPTKAKAVQECLKLINSGVIMHGDAGTRGLMTLLQQARHSLRMETLGPISAVFPQGMVFDYFDEVRKLLQLARADVLFVDPYLDADFVARYLPHVAAGVAVRLLARERLATLLPAVDAFTRQSNARVEVRSAQGFHDRYVFIDAAGCYQSGASFKDGARTAPTTLTQITDAFAAVQKTYEDIWIQAKSER